MKSFLKSTLPAARTIPMTKDASPGLEPPSQHDRSCQYAGAAGEWGIASRHVRRLVGERTGSSS
eukprot:1693640-Rhodomonas_salina.3